ncbi:MAG: hypothetical protein M3457_06185 [Chloroflexota bacterium]|nr:hypothetical protein [Chloroflexota bacterium]
MCANCGFPAALGHWTEAGFGNSPHDRVRARFRRVQVLQSILPAFGLTAHDDIHTPGITLGNLTGNNAIVANLTELWNAAETLGSGTIDPLDAHFTGAPAPGSAKNP